MAPRAYGSHWGAPSPVNAGTKHDAARVGNALGQRLYRRRRVGELQPLDQPLHDGTAREDGALQGVLDAPARTGGDGCGQAPRVHAPAAGVHQREHARAERRLGVARGETPVAHERRLLIAADARDGDRRPQ